MFFLIASLLLFTARAQETSTAQVQSSSAETEHASGLQLGLDSKSDAISNVSGGVRQRTVWLGTLDLSASVDLERLISAKGSSLRLDALGSYGNAPSQAVGDIQYTSNIEAAPSIRLYQAWFQQNLAQDRVSLLAGLHDLNTEFYVTDASVNLLNSSFGIGPELSHTGRNGISVFPTTSLGARARVQATENLKLQVAAYDGVPGDPADPNHTHVILRPEEGVLAIGEADYAYALNGQPGSIGVGGWAYSSRSDDLSETDENGQPIRSRALGAYVLLNQKLYSPIQGAPRGLAMFTRMGYATPDVNPISFSVASGLSYTGLIPRRLEDQVAIGVAIAQTGSHSVLASLARNEKPLAWSEMAWEVTYRAKLASWLFIQPDLQWVLNPSMDPDVARAIVAGTRLELTL